MSLTTSTSSFSLESSISDFNSIGTRIVEFLRLLETREWTKLNSEYSTYSQIDILLEQKWNSIKNEFDDMAEEGRIDIPLYYTKIIEFHLNNMMTLSPLISQSLLYCIEPSYIDEVFKRNLIDYKCNKLHILLDEEYLFIGIEEMDTYPYSFNTLLSLAVLIYRFTVYQSRRGIKASIFDRLVDFCLHETYDRRVREISIKYLLDACILNGLLSFNDIRQFFNKNCNPVMHGLDTDSDNDGHNENYHDRSKTVADNLGLNQQQFHYQYPLSLKNQSRIKIKSLLKVYNQRSIENLQLPLSIKKFLLFNDKIDEILKIADVNK